MGITLNELLEGVEGKEEKKEEEREKEEEEEKEEEKEEKKEEDGEGEIALLNKIENSFLEIQRRIEIIDAKLTNLVAPQKDHMRNVTNNTSYQQQPSPPPPQPPSRKSIGGIAYHDFETCSIFINGRPSDFGHVIGRNRRVVIELERRYDVEICIPPKVRIQLFPYINVSYRKTSFDNGINAVYDILTILYKYGSVW